MVQFAKVFVRHVKHLQLFMCGLICDTSNVCQKTLDNNFGRNFSLFQLKIIKGVTQKVARGKKKRRNVKANQRMKVFENYILFPMVHENSLVQNLKFPLHNFSQ